MKAGAFGKLILASFSRDDFFSIGNVHSFEIKMNMISLIKALKIFYKLLAPPVTLGSMRFFV
ncbi:hypothetical protein J9303_11315 [Bacillaceae bacterium Marseille-Q3522]|nr:hypothetical protein [Bacillaceae bacterium Marseille-Q3522]